MPLPPSIWYPGAPVTPYQLNSDLYTYVPGNNHNPSGIKFHATPPILMENLVAAISGGQTANGTKPMGNTAGGSWRNHLDNSVLNSPNRGDGPGIAGFGLFVAVVPGSDGTASGGAGGVGRGGNYLAIIQAGWGVAGSAGGAGTLLYTDGSTTIWSYGGVQQASTTRNNLSYLVDVIGPWIDGTYSASAGGYSDVTGAAIAYLTNNVDYVGETSRTAWLWAGPDASSSAPVIGWTVLQSAGVTSGDATNCHATYTNNLSAGTKLIAAIQCDAFGQQLCTAISDGNGHSFTKVSDTGNVGNTGFGGGQLWYLDTPAGDVGIKPTITATFDINQGYPMAMVIQEVAGLLPGAGLDGLAGTLENFNNSGTTPITTASPAYSSSKSGEYLVSFISYDNNTGQNPTFTQAAGYTLDPNSQQSSGRSGACIAYKNSTGGPESDGWTITGGAPGGANFQGWGVTLAAFQTASPAGTLPVPATGFTSASQITSALLNSSSGIRGALTFLNNPPLLRATGALSTSIPANTNGTLIPLNTAQIDSYGGFSTGTSTYTVPISGVYLVHGAIAWSANTTSERQTAVLINNTTLAWGPAYSAAGAGITVSLYTGLLDLLAGDTLVLVGSQGTSGSLSLSSSPALCRLVVRWMGSLGGLSTLTWTPPDVGFRWQAGTPGSQLPGLFNTHLSNDLSFLLQRPYFLGYQQTAQSGLAQNAFQVITMDTVSGRIHGSPGDNYGGWVSGSTNRYVAVVPGWYLAVAGYIQSVPSSTPAHLIGAIGYYQSGGTAQGSSAQFYGQHVRTTSSGFYSPGSDAVGLFYLRAGDYLQPQYQQQDGGATFSTFVQNNGVHSSFGLIWVSE